MEVVRDDLWLCVDCTMYAVNGDTTGIDAYYSSDEESLAREKAVVDGVNALGPDLVPDYEAYGDGHEEFSDRGCDGCGSDLAGEKHRFAVLGEPAKNPTEPTDGSHPRYRWRLTVEIDVAELWVADGYEPSPERLEEMLRCWWMRPSEQSITVKVEEAPDADKVAQAMGYKDAAHRKERDR